MEFSRAELLSMVREALGDPRASARRVLALGLSRQARRIAMALVGILPVIAIYLIGVLSGVPAAALPPPIPMAIIQIVVIFISAVAVRYVGAQFGGRGSFEDALLLMVWLQAILILLLPVQVVVMFLLPPLAGLFTYAVVGLFLWLMTGFVAELHGFRSLGRVFGGILACFIGLSLVLAALMGALVGTQTGTF